MHTEILPLQVLAPGAAGAPASVAPGGNYSLTIKNSRTAAMVLALWGFNQATGWLQWTAPSLHDMIRGFRVDVLPDEPLPRMPLGLSLNPQPQETQQVTIAGSAVVTEYETACALILYGDLPGVAARMADWDDVRRRTVELTTISATLTGSGRGRTGVETIIDESDLLKANRNYAVLGITTSTSVPAIFINGPDTGNVDVGLPGNSSDTEGLQNFFVTLARAYNKPLIPVINSGNKASTYIGFIQNETNVSPLVTLYLALLD